MDHISILSGGVGAYRLHSDMDLTAVPTVAGRILVSP